jgi:(S)-sulfolactate dehydrogenase
MITFSWKRTTPAAAVTDIIIAEPMEERIVRELGLRFDVRYDRALAFDLGALTGALSEARALIVGEATVVDAELIAAAPRLQVIGCLGSAVGRVDEAACRARGIEIHAAPGIDDGSRGGQVFDAILDLLGQPGRSGTEPAQGGVLLGLVGFGRISRDVAALALHRGLRVAAYDPLLERDDPLWRETGVEPMALHRLLEEADAVSLHVPLSEETRELIDWVAIVEMKPGAVLVNASHPEVVDAAAVRAAIRTRRLGGAVLDVDGERTEGLVPQPALRIGALIAAKVQATLEARR